MRHQCSAFSLLELLVATLISSFIGVVLMAALRQGAVVQRLIQNESAYLFRSALLERQLRRDIEGIFVPTCAFPVAKKEAPAGGPHQSLQKGDKSLQKKESIPKDQKAEQEEAMSVLKDYFLLIKKDEQFELCTFITSNPIMGYQEGPLAVLKPRVVRVVYQLKKDKTQKKSFTLYRQEGKDFELEKYMNAKEGLLRPYELVSGIKSIKIECVFFEQVKGGLSSNKKMEWKRDLQTEFLEKEKQKKVNAPSKNTDSSQKQEEAFLPDALLITVTLWDSEFVRESTYRFYVPIFAVAQEPKTEDALEKNKQETKRPVENVAHHESSPLVNWQMPSMSLGIKK